MEQRGSKIKRKREQSEGTYMVYKIERMVWFKVIIRVGLGCTHRRGCLAVLRLFPSTLVGCAVDIREKM